MYWMADSFRIPAFLKNVSHSVSFSMNPTFVVRTVGLMNCSVKPVNSNKEQTSVGKMARCLVVCLLLIKKLSALKFFFRKGKITDGKTNGIKFSTRLQYILLRKHFDYHKAMNGCPLSAARPVAILEKCLDSRNESKLYTALSGRG